MRGPIEPSENVNFLLCETTTHRTGKKIHPLFIRDFEYIREEGAKGAP